jgi:hypothetical protein
MSVRRGQRNQGRRSAGRLGALVLGAALLAGQPALAQGGAAPAGTCSVSDMVHDLRAALQRGSPALKSYMRELFKEASIGLPFEELRRAFAAEREPEVLEVLGAAIAARSSRESNPSYLRPVLERITFEPEAEARAASVRALRGIGSVGAMAQLDGPRYDRLIRDASPEVRQAVADNLLHENAQVYFGHDQAVSEMAVSAAVASEDPKVAAKLLSEVSMEQVGAETVTQLVQQLRSEHEGVRAAAALALGGVPGPQAQGAREALLHLYRRDDSPRVRRAVLEGLVHLGLGQAAPVLESLRGVDPAMAAEIEAWKSVLALNLQEWHLVQREKQRLRP